MSFSNTSCEYKKKKSGKLLVHIVILLYFFAIFCRDECITRHQQSRERVIMEERRSLKYQDKLCHLRQCAGHGWQGQGGMTFSFYCIKISCWLVVFYILSTERSFRDSSPFTGPCKGREARFLHCPHRESNPGRVRGSLLRNCCATPALLLKTSCIKINYILCQFFNHPLCDLD